MVNELDRLILSVLSLGNDVSGEQLSQKFGISRVAVWKRIKKLQEEGFNITSSSKGYTLVSDTYDFVAIGTKFDSLEYHYSVNSTMDFDLSREGDEAHRLILTETQTGGRGRKKREWLSPEGGLYYTYMWQTDIALDSVMKIMLGAVVSIVETVETYGVKACAKWPNEVLVNGSKLAGVLVEFTGEFDMVRQVKTGFGIHINASNPESPGITLSTCAGKRIDRTEFLMKQFEIFQEMLDGLDSCNITKRWKECSDTIGMKVSIRKKTGSVSGYASDISDAGYLIIQEENGKKRTVTSGDCEYIVE